MEKLKGLTIGLDLDTLKIDSGLKDLKLKLNLVNSEMRSNMSAFDRSDKSIGKYEKRLEGLNKKIEVQKTVTDKAHKSYEKMVAEHGEGSKEADKAAAAYNHESASLNNLERYVGSVTEELKEMKSQQKLAESSWHKFGESITKTGTKLTKVGDGMKKVGKDLSMKVTAPILAAGTAAFKFAVDFESAFAGVRKTVDMTEPEFAVLSDGIRGMAKEIPAAATEIAGVAEAAGQLGIKKEAILGFTRTMVDLGVATNMSSDEAATALARFANITQMSQTDFDRLGSSVVELGNNFATTEKEIVDMSLRLAGAGAQVGMSEADILALATALSSVGIEAEMGGSAISRVMVNMQVATSAGFTKMQDLMKKTGMSLRDLQMMASHDGKGFGELAYSLGMTKKELNALVKAGGDLEGFSKVAGMTGEEFKQAFEKDAVGALGEFINGLANAEASGESAINMLQEMGITEIRLRDSLLRAGGASELFANAVNLSSDAWDENNALTKEAEERYKTTASQMTIMWNKTKDIGITIGGLLIPKVTALMDKLDPLIDRFSNMSTKSQNMTLLFGGLAAAVGPLLVVGGLFATSLGAIFTGIGTVSGAIAVVTTGAAAATPAIGALASAFTVLTGPVGLIIAGLAAVTIGTVALVKHFKKDAIPEVERFGKGVSDATQEALGGFFDLSDGVTQYMTEISITGSRITSEMKDGIVEKYAEMNAQILEGTATRHNEELAQMESMFLNTSALTDKEKEDILTKKQEQYDKEVERLQYNEAKIKEILELAAKEKRELTEREKTVINNINEQAQEAAVKVLSESEMEQKIIFERMKDSAAELSAKQAAEVVKNSAEARVKSVKEAEGQYDETYAAIVRMRDETGELTAEQATAMIKEAKKSRDETVKHAETMHKDVVSEAKKQAEEHVNHVNWETGEILSKWQVFTKGVGTTFSNLWKSTGEWFSKIDATVNEKIESAKSGAKDKLKEMSIDFALQFANIVKDGKAKFDDLVAGVIALPGKIAKGIKSTKSVAITAVKLMGNGMLEALEKPINGMLGGVNWVTDKLGIKKKIANVVLPRYAKGTSGDGHKGGLAIVGEEGRELIKFPNGKSIISPGTDTMMNLPKGTHVIPNKPTEDILNFDLPHYAKGTGLWENIKGVGSKIKGGIKNVWDKVGDVWEYATNPSKLVTKLLEGLGIGDVSGFAKDLGGSAWDFAKTKPLEYIKSMFGQAEDEGLAPGSGKPAFKWPVTSGFGGRYHPIHKTWRPHNGTDFGAPSGSPIPSTTGGKVSFAGRMGGFGNLVKVKNGVMEMFYAHMSKIMVSGGQSVKKGNILGLVGSTGDSTGPHLHYETRKNGVPINPMGIKGFANGGLIKKQQLAMVGEGNFEEIIIPTGDPRKRTNAMKLLALAGKKLGVDGGSVGPSGLPNVTNRSNEQLEKVIEKLSEQVEDTKEIVSLLAQLLLKDNRPVIDKRSLSRALEPDISILQSRRGDDHGIYGKG